MYLLIMQRSLSWNPVKYHFAREENYRIADSVLNVYLQCTYFFDISKTPAPRDHVASNVSAGTGPGSLRGNLAPLCNS